MVGGFSEVDSDEESWWGVSESDAESVAAVGKTEAATYETLQLDAAANDAHFASPSTPYVPARDAHSVPLFWHG